MSAPAADPLWVIAEQVADCLSQRGYAFVEDDKLARALEEFLCAAGIPVHPDPPRRPSCRVWSLA